MELGTGRKRRTRSICVTKYVRSPSRRTSLSANFKCPTDSTCLFKVLEEEEVLTYFEQLSEIDDTALKVFRRDDHPQDDNPIIDDDVPPLKSYVSSCHALKQAVTMLYNMGDFELKKIGEGFFSEVFQVTHKVNGSIKVLKRNKHRANRNAMLKEVQLLKNLNHCNVLKYEGAVVHEGQLHALTEFINGGSLDQLIMRGSREAGHFPWLDRSTLALDITEALSYLHNRGIFHRDLTSKNILIRQNSSSSLSENDTASVPHAVVADFGLAAQIPQSERLPQVGSPYWMSPECLKGLFYNHSSDIFSFGIILCEIIARVEADPDFLPRTENFGVDYRAFSDLVSQECPTKFLQVAFSCVTILPEQRPSSAEVNSSLTQITKDLRTKESIKLMEQRLNGLTLKTPCVAIGEKMSQLDPHYIPSKEGVNPFLQLFGESKIVNHRYSCFEFKVNSPKIERPIYRKTVSLIGSHPQI